MKRFIIDCIGAVIIVAIATLSIPLYNDHQSRLEVEGWLAQLQPTQQAIARQALRRGSVKGSGAGIREPFLESTQPALLRIDDNGQIMLKGALTGQIMILIPSLNGKEVSWTCVGGPDDAMPPPCRHTLPPD